MNGYQVSDKTAFSIRVYILPLIKTTKHISCFDPVSDCNLNTKTICIGGMLEKIG